MLVWSQTQRLSGWQCTGRLDFRCCGWRLCRSGIDLYSVDCWIAAWHPSLYVSCFLHRFGGAMPDRISNSPVGVGRKHSVIRRSVSFSPTSSFLLWQLRHQTGPAYSAALKTNAIADVRMVGVLAPHDEQSRQCRRLLRARIFWHRPSTCYL